ncbi:uncharacterized protein LOC124363724 [Homalodisca vitripennis]|uniref:uncharacterized protein LOC124363724 n=1 Tax=Homalodisca vitripennis TaxID=197043 RepID=UPI001EEAB26B|nr:uncharacterized protein LOC124363724 [Homalodisca vitripennis]
MILVNTSAGTFSCFADDVKIFREISSAQQQNELQRDLDGVDQWCVINEMDLNPTKCVSVSFSRARQTLLFDYYLQEAAIRRVDRIRDLGVLLTSNLDPSAHISDICSRANRVLGLINRTCRQHFAIPAIRTLYVTLVRPILEYSVTVWSPHQVGHCSSLDAVQRRFLRMVGVKMGYRYLETNLEEMGQQLHLPSLGCSQGSTGSHVPLQTTK